MKDTSEHACIKQFDVIHELGMYIITVGGLVTNMYKLYIINQSINQECMSPLLEVIPRTTDLHVSAKTEVTSMYIIHLKLSIHLILGLPLGLLLSITPTYTLLVVLSLFMSSNVHFQFSRLLLIMSKMSSCPSCCLISSLLILSNLLTPWILLITLIWVACILLCCCFVRLHTSQPYNNEGTIMALTTVSFVFYLAFCAYSRSCLQPFLQHSQSLPPLPSPSCMPSLLNIPPKYFISSTCSIT